MNPLQTYLADRPELRFSNIHTNIVWVCVRVLVNWLNNEVCTVHLLFIILAYHRTLFNHVPFYVQRKIKAQVLVS